MGGLRRVSDRWTLGCPGVAVVGTRFQGSPGVWPCARGGIPRER